MRLAAAERRLELHHRLAALPPEALRNLADRARECGGRLSVSPVEPSGTRLTWRVPLSGA